MLGNTDRPPSRGERDEWDWRRCDDRLQPGLECTTSRLRVGCGPTRRLRNQATTSSLQVAAQHGRHRAATDGESGQLEGHQVLTRRAKALSRPSRAQLRLGLAVLALGIVVTGTPALVGAATGVGARLELGKANSVNATTSLTATATGSAFSLKNLGTGVGLNITVNSGKSPITVSAGAGKATNLNADMVDGIDGSQLQKRVSTTCPSGKAISAIAADGTATCVTIGISSSEQLNGISCPNNGLLLLVGSTPITLDCVTGADEEIAEPNNSQGTAYVADPLPFFFEALTGPADDDWYVSTSPDLCTGSGPYQCSIVIDLQGTGVVMDVRRDGSLVASNVTQFFSDAATYASVPQYHVRVHASQHLPYKLVID